MDKEEIKVTEATVEAGVSELSTWKVGESESDLIVEAVFQAMMQAR